MKININYDLLDRIATAKTGMRLMNKNRANLFSMCLTFPLIVLTEKNILDILKRIVSLSAINYSLGFSMDLLFSSMNKDLAKKWLENLAIMLKDIDVNTTGDLLLDSYKYKTEYEIKRNEKNLPILEQRKYIMVPTEDANGEVSLLQEHIIGTKDYSLSYGSPKKVLKLVPNTI